MEIKRQVDGSRRLLGSVEHDSHVGAAGMAAMAGWAGGDEYLAVGARDRAWRGMAWHAHVYRSRWTPSTNDTGCAISARVRCVRYVARA